VSARRAAAALALSGAVLLVLAEFTTVFGGLAGGRAAQRDGGENHGYALLVIGLVACAMTLLALRERARAPAYALVTLGVAALAVALAIDLPDTRASGHLPESLAYEQARSLDDRFGIDRGSGRRR
jgi:hypothetical protein